MIIVITSLTKRINLNVNILFVLFHLDMTWAQNSLGGLKESSKDLHHADIAGSMLTRNAFCKRCSTLYAKICKFLYSFVRLCELLDFTDSFFLLLVLYHSVSYHTFRMFLFAIIMKQFVSSLYNITLCILQFRLHMHFYFMSFCIIHLLLWIFPAL